jgi:hypothetical protein
MKWAPMSIWHAFRQSRFLTSVLGADEADAVRLRSARRGDAVCALA